MSRRSAPSLNERKHHPAEQQSFCQAPAITQHDQPPLCSSPGAPGHLTPTGGKPNEGESASGAVCVTGSEAPHTKRGGGSRASLFSAGLPAPSRRETHKGSGGPRRCAPGPACPAPPARRTPSPFRQNMVRPGGARPPSFPLLFSLLPSLPPPGQRGNAGAALPGQLLGRVSPDHLSAFVTALLQLVGSQGSALGKEVTVIQLACSLQITGFALLWSSPPRLVCLQKVL